MKNKIASFLILSLSILLLAPQAFAELTRADIEAALAKRGTAAKVKALKKLTESSDSFSDAKTKAMFQVVFKAVAPDYRDIENPVETPKEVVDAVFELMGQKLDMLPTRILEVPGYKYHYALVQMLLDRAQNGNDMRFIAAAALQAQRDTESRDQYKDRIYQSIDALHDRVDNLRTAEASKENTDKLVAAETALGNLITKHPDLEVRAHAERIMGAERINYKEEKVVENISVGAWKNLAKELPAVVATGRPTMIAAHTKLLADHAAHLKAKPEDSKEMEKTLAALLTAKNTDPEVHRIALEQLSKLELSDPATYVSLQADGIDDKNSKVAKRLIKKMEAGPILSADPKMVPMLEGLIDSTLASKKNLAMAIETARLMGTQNTALQEQLFDLANMKSTQASIRAAANKALDDLSAKNLITFETAERMLARHNERRLRYPFEQDKRLVVALRQGPVKITKELLDTVRSANYFGLMEIAQEHMARRTQNADFTRAFLERMFSPELTEPERAYLAHNVHKYLRFPEQHIAEIVRPHLDTSDPMNAAATIFVDKAARVKDAPVVDWERILPEDAASSRTEQTKIDPTCFRKLSKKNGAKEPAQ
jgi:hypothetical protein